MIIDRVKEAEITRKDKAASGGRRRRTRVSESTECNVISTCDDDSISVIVCWTRCIIRESNVVRESTNLVAFSTCLRDYIIDYRIFTSSFYLGPLI
jgi:hypothetical protein